MISEGKISSKGDFVRSSHPTSRLVTVNLDETILKLSSFKIDVGPQLNFYLATDLKIILNYKSKDFSNFRN